ncbi:MAG: leucine-rich repeat domain-containing protein [Prevotellaceae bacterium]|jgi:Leucine-rich repeat (LRR) protein|nr:leucine-rich repeat domain-containing protein [Prevotellaceae bacterium]
MKKIKILAFSSIILLSLAVLSCSKDEDNGGIEIYSSEIGQVEIKCNADSQSKQISFNATAQKITIDWGDGTEKEEITPNGVTKTFSHEYDSATVLHTISVNAEDLTEITFNDFLDYGDISELRFNDCPKLKSIYAITPNLTVFEINKTDSLTYLSVSGNVTSLDISNCINLKELYCNSSRLTTLDISKCTNLKVLHCSSNQLTTLDISKCTNLEALYCSSNQLTSLDISKCTNLNILYCSSNLLTLLDISESTELTELNCYNNQLTSLDLSTCTKLTVLDCRINQLTSLDVSGCIDMTMLDCSNNQFTTLDISECTKLTDLHCSNNQLTSLDVSGCTNLAYLYCEDNQLTSLDVSGCTNLAYLYCRENKLIDSALNSLFASLPWTGGRIYCGDNPGSESCDTSIAENKGWSVYTD